jgi:hypothetical protein
MDLPRLITELRAQKERIERAIAELESLGSDSTVEGATGRGRKWMPAEERLQVSERMKRYWERKHKDRSG